MEKRTGSVDQPELRKYLVRYRTDPSTPLNLDFDAFVVVFNAFLAAQRSGDLDHATGWGLVQTA
jgi:hypothetical protein